MPWSKMSTEQQRKEAAALAQVSGANIAELSRRLGVSRTCLYKWVEISRFGGSFSGLSRRPKTSPYQTSPEIEERILAFRREHRWGGRKISNYLREHENLKVAASTVTDILRRHGLLDGPRSGQKRDWQRFERSQPNELWQLDFKGHFPTLSGDRCHALDCLDDHSRFCLCLRACTSENTGTVKECLIEAFRTYGLPLEILCDNGGCWGARGARELSPITLWMSQLGIEVIHGRPYHPQTQGKLERFHRSLDYEVLEGRGFRDLLHCQDAFDRFRTDYNLIRSHEALQDKTPVSVYRVSPRTFPEGPLKEPDYEPDVQTRKVQDGGIVHFKGREFRIGKCLKGKTIGIKPSQEDGTFQVSYGKTNIADIDLREDTDNLISIQGGEGKV